jgi:hypothetical protein
MPGKMLLDYRTKDKKTSTGCQKGAGSLFLCLKCNQETKNIVLCFECIYLFLGTRENAFYHFQRAIQVSKQRPRLPDEAKATFSLAFGSADGQLVSLVVYIKARLRQKIIFFHFQKFPPNTLAGFNLTTHCSNLLSGRRRLYHKSQDHKKYIFCCTTQFVR